MMPILPIRSFIGISNDEAGEAEEEIDRQKAMSDEIPAAVTDAISIK